MSSAVVPIVNFAGDCSRPIPLLRRTVNTKTGEVNHCEMWRRCQNRIASKCPSCSSLYRGDAIAVFRAGLMNEANKPRPFTLITLTAPGAEVFGQVHSSHTRTNGAVKPCACRVRHSKGTAVLGTPINVATYNYQAAADFNAHASRLFAVTKQKLERILKRKLKVIRVVEFQRRGLVHIHAVIIGCLTQGSLELATRGGTNPRTKRQIAPAVSDSWHWGRECKADVIAGGEPGRAIFYMNKAVSYSLKDTSSSSDAKSEHGRKMARAGSRSCNCGLSRSECLHGEQFFDVTYWECDRSGIVSKCIKKFAYQSKQRNYPCRRHRIARNGWGFRGHVLAKSKAWPLTFTAVRAERREWCRKKFNWLPLPSHFQVTWQVMLHRGLGSFAYATSPPN